VSDAEVTSIDKEEEDVMVKHFEKLIQGIGLCGLFRGVTWRSRLRDIWKRLLRCQTLLNFEP
jgi:hypothetical protein